MILFFFLLTCLSLRFDYFYNWIFIYFKTTTNSNHTNILQKHFLRKGIAELSQICFDI